MKTQGFELFQYVDLDKYDYPVALVIGGDTFSDMVIGPFETKNQLEAYIDEKNLSKSHDKYEITHIEKP